MANLTAFTQDGYLINNFTNVDALALIKEICEAECKLVLDEEFTSLSNYHLISISKSDHDKLQYRIFEKVNDAQIHHQFVKDNIDFFQSLVGFDIDVQTQCYVRIARPGCSGDNIGLHRDTDYGNSAYEVSLSLPLIDQSEGVGLCVVPRSHEIDNYQTVQSVRGDVEKGSDKNKMGFLYAPKAPQNIPANQIKCVSLEVGQGLAFSLGLIHGQLQNTGSMTRWSIDFRFKNSFYPLSANLKKGYYSNVTSSPATIVAEKYYSLNPEERESLSSDRVTT